MRIAHAFAVLTLLASQSAFAGVPTRVTYQGRLTSAGAPVNTTVSMTVKLYDALTDGNLIWSETHSVAVANGLYTVVLGETTLLDETVLAPQPYLTVAVEGEADLTPRTPLTATPYAILAKALDGTIAPSQISGTVGVTKGGTGWNTVATGGLLYGQGTSTLGVTSAGSAGQVLIATAGGVPQWSNSAPNLTITHPGSLFVQSTGSFVQVQGVKFENGDIRLGANVIAINGLQVLGARQPIVFNAVSATGIDVASDDPAQVVTVAEFNALVTRFNDLLERIRTHGLIEP